MRLFDEAVYVPYTSLCDAPLLSATFALPPSLSLDGDKGTAASAAAAGLSEALTMPVDVAKIRLQVQNNGPVGDVRYKGMTDCILRTVRNEGFRALFKGLGPALMRQMGYTGISFLLYEPIRNGISPAGTMISCPCVLFFDSAMF